MGARSDVRPPAQGVVPNTVGRTNPFAQSEEPEWVKPQVLLDKASSLNRDEIADRNPIARPQRPRKPVALSQPTGPTSQTAVNQHGDLVRIENMDQDPRPRLPPRPPTWDIADHDSTQPRERGFIASRTSPNLLDETDPVLEKWKPLLPHR